MPQKFNTILFDLDGTLIDSRADLVSAVNHVLNELRLPVQPFEEITARIGNGLRSLLTESLESMDEPLYQKAKVLFDDFYLEHCVDETKLYQHVLHSLSSFQGHHLMGVVTNKPKSYADKILVELKLAPFFGVVMGGDSLPQFKPHPAPLLKAMEILKGQLESTLMVGDGIQDIKAGKAAGMKTCLVKYGIGFHPQLLELKPDFVIDDFSELKEIVL